MSEIRGQPYTYYTPVFLDGERVTSPPIADGDFRISIDGSAFADLDALPIVTPMGSQQVKIELTAAEMDGEAISLYWHDPDGAWDDDGILIQTSLQGIDDVATPSGVWNYLISAGFAVGSIGELIVDFINAVLASWNPDDPAAPDGCGPTPRFWK
jgi:hypothetical protein